MIAEGGTRGGARGSRPRAALPGVAAVGAGERGPTRLEPRHRDPERRARHVVQTDVMEEVHRIRIAAVLAADTELETGACGATLLGRDPDQPADPFPAERL